MNTPIILLGPLGAGKTTTGRLLASKLDLPCCSIDQVRAFYYQRLGYDDRLAARIGASPEGLQSVLRYSKPFEARMVEQVLLEHHGIIDFGASNSVYEDEELFTRVEKALAPYPNVILLLPSRDLDESAAILEDRLIRMLDAEGKAFTDELFQLNAYFIKHPSNHRLAKRVIYTRDKQPTEVCVEIIANPDIR